MDSKLDPQKLLSRVAACEAMVGLLLETGLKEDQEGYCDVIRKHLAELRSMLSAQLGGQDVSKAPQLLHADGARVRALVVDDDEVQRLFISRSLEKAGIQVATVRNGKEAVEYFQHESVDIIVMDCQMPVMDGFEATIKIRALEGNSGGHVPIVAYTGHHIAGYKQLCLKSGMDTYLRKPLPSQELANEVVKIAKEHLRKQVSVS